MYIVRWGEETTFSIGFRHNCAFLPDVFIARYFFIFIIARYYSYHSVNPLLKTRLIAFYERSGKNLRDLRSASHRFVSVDKILDYHPFVVRLVERITRGSQLLF